MTDRKLLATCTTICVFLAVLIMSPGAATIKIRPQSCSNAVGDTGTCMFVWQCIKSDGVQLGPCVDRFLVGSCCRLPAEEDNLVPGASDLDKNTSKVKPAASVVHTTALPPPPSTEMTSASLTIGTQRPTLITATHRPIAPAVVVPQSAPSQAPGHTQAVMVTDAPASEDYSECGISNARPKGKVVGGTHSMFGEWPWQVSVRRSAFLFFSSTHRCGGAILSANWIATAGHCVDDIANTHIRVRVGEYDFSTAQEPFPYQERGIEKKVVHPRYNFFTYEYDLALLKLDSSLVLQPHVRPICLPPDSASESSLVGVNATVTGWGRLSEGGSLPSKLQQVQVPIISNARCKEMFQTAGRQESIPDIFLCAGYEAGGRDSCQGDSGGPLQAKGEDGRWFLAGIISWGIGCAEPNMPGVCTRISKFKDWILQTIS